MAKTVAATQPGSALLSFAPHPCRERIHPFRVSRFYLHSPVGLTQQPYRQQRKGAIKKVQPKAAHHNYSIFTIHHSLFIGAVTDRPFLSSPQGEDNLVRRKIQHRTHATRNAMVSANVPNRAPAITVLVAASIRLRKKTVEDGGEILGQVGGYDDMLARARMDEFQLARVQALAAKPPVSYTHLDVYKRQHRACRVCRRRQGYLRALRPAQRICPEDTSCL